MDAINTRLRVIKAKKVDTILAVVNSLPFKVEIKGAPVFDGKRWHLFFVIPDHVEFKDLEV